VTRHEREQFLKLLQAHAQTVAICEACATTTRDLATEVARGSTPSRNDLMATVAEAERALKDLAGVREEVERLLATLGSA
jgi:sulfur relay (sulfurtransferase) complex TusBCD TusD component (DsrE family)